MYLLIIIILVRICLSNIYIKNGIVMDGTGQKAYKADILIKDDKIAEIGMIKEHSNSQIINATGLVACPGFIDVHSHLDFLMPSPRHAKVLESWARQGVTTIISGNCGYSPAPINHEIESDLEKYWYFAYPRDGLRFSWNTMEEFFSYLESKGIQFNLGMLTGHSTLRANAMGFETRLPSKNEMEEMKEMLKDSLKAGSLGLSLGLDYVPGAFSNTEELVELASVLTPFNAPLVPHTRGFLGKLFIEGIREVIEVAERNKIPLHLSHHAGGGISRARKVVLKEIGEAIKRGLKISHDNIPFPNSSTTVLNLFPPWAFEGGMNAFFKRLTAKEIKDKIKQEMYTFKPKWPPWKNQWWTSRGYNEHIFLFGFKQEKNKAFNNLELIKIAEILKQEPLEALIDLVLSEDGKVFYISGQFDNPLAEDFVEQLLLDPLCSVGTDIVGADFNTISPAACGAFTKVLGNLAREKAIFSVEEAVRKMTSLPASQMQLEKRGMIKKEFYADIAIFDPKKVRCNASYTTPGISSSGIAHVLVNGKIILENGNYNEEVLAGRVLRKI